MKKKPKTSKFISEKNIFIFIGIFIVIHWILLVIDRITYNILPNLFWMSHLALLLAAIGFISRNNLLLTASLISIFVIHGVWIYDLVVTLTTNLTPFDFTPYILKLPFYRKILSSHHIYLIPLLLVALWRQKKLSKYGWLLASGIFAFATFFSYFFLPRSFNINCAHYACDIALKILPFNFLTKLSPMPYLIVLNIITAIMIFLLTNIIIYYIFRKIQPHIALKKIKNKASSP